MMMRKDFIRIAEILQRYQASPEMVKAFANYCATRNPSFDYGKFRAASAGRMIDAKD